MRRIIDKNRGNEYCRFSVWFLFCVVVILLPLGLLRRSLIQEGDSFNQSFPLFVYIGQWLRACLHGEIKFFDFRLGLGDDVLHALNWHGFGDITQIFSIVVPYEYSEYAYNMIMIFKLWLCGIAFLIYSRRYIVHMEYRIAGALVYACNSYTLAWGFNCWMFLMPVMTFPLILAGIDVICSKEDNFSGLLLVGIWIQSLNGFYFLYMEVLLSALYFVIKEIIILQDIVTGRFKRLIQDGLSVLGQAMVAVSIGAPLLLPSFAGYLQSSRTGSTKAYGIWEMLIYPFNHYCTVLAHLLIPNIYRNILTLGYPVIFGIVISFFHSSRQNKLHRYLLILFSVLYCIPLWGSITNGFSYSTDRWIFGLILIAAILMAIGSDMEVASSGKEKLLFCLLSCISVILYLVDEDWYSGKIFSAIFYGIIGIIILFLWDKRKKDSKIVLLCCIVLLSINGILVFLPRKAGGSGYVYGFKGKESTRQEVDQRIDMLEPIGDKFERKDVYSTSLGASLIKDFYGTTEYFSTLNGNSSEFYRELYISPGVYGATWVLKGLDGRMELEALLSVGEIMDYTGDGFEIVYRHNDMYLPLGIAYQSWISREQFDQMNPMEKEASLIQYIVLEEQEEDIVKLVPKADEVDGSISGSNQEVTFSAVMVNVIEEGNIIHAKEDAAIRLYLNDVNVCDQKFPVETELYVKLQDMKLHDEGTADLSRQLLEQSSDL